MKLIKFSYRNALVAKSDVSKTLKRLMPEVERMNRAASFILERDRYADNRSSINLPDDEDYLRKIKSVIESKRRLNPEVLVVVGIGGSNLGTIAVQEAVLGRMHNQLNPRIKVLYADTVDSDLISDIIKIIEPVLRRGGNVIVNGVSKSGATTETTANFEILVSVLRKYKSDYSKCVVVTTDRNSNFWNLAVAKGFDVLEVPMSVGGRYSVFSSVGLFPLGLLGCNIDELLRGAGAMKKACLSMSLNKNPAAIGAALLYLSKKKGKTINDTFLFNTDLESVGKWHRQLMAESLGKEFDVGGGRVNEGITPTVSVGSTDLHSMAQLYLGGPRDKFTTFVTLEKTKTEISVPNFTEYSKLVDKIQGKSLSTIMSAILEGVKIAFRKDRRAFTEIVLPDKSESSVGQLLQLKMIEIMYLGFLLGVNPFDQPNVERYKIETKKILAKE